LADVGPVMNTQPAQQGEKNETTSRSRPAPGRASSSARGVADVCKPSTEAIVTSGKAGTRRDANTLPRRALACR
jgi:hypothetical protein